MFPVDYTMVEGKKLAWKLHGTMMVLGLENYWDSFVTGNFDMTAEMILLDSCIRLRQDKIVTNLAWMGRIAELALLEVAMIEEYSKLHHLKILQDKIADDTSQYCWDHDDPFPVTATSKCGF